MLSVRGALAVFLLRNLHKSMFWTRFKSVLVFVPLMLVMIYLGGIPFQVFILLVLGVAGWEYWRLLTAMDFKPSMPVVISGIILLVLHRTLFEFKYADLVLAGLVFLLTFYSLISYERGNNSAAINFVLHLSGILYVGWVGSYLISIRGIEGGVDGRWWLLTALPIVWLVDLGAYTFGVTMGKHKMVPRLSPKKSWEGFAGGILFGAGFGALLSLLWRRWLPDFSAWQGALMGFVLAILTPVGDLFISMLKREAKVKDSSNLIPGHGGILDRIDTWIWAALICYYLIQLFEKI